MRTTLFVVGALGGLAIAQPHLRHQHQHDKKQVVDVVTETDYVTATAPDAVVYVDSNGNPIWTSWQGQPPPTSSPEASSVAPASYAAPSSWSPHASSVAPAPASSSYVPPPVPTPTSSAAPAEAPTTKAPASYAAPTTDAPAPTSSSSSGSGSSGHGLSYSPYNSDASCKSQDQVNSDFASISGYGMIRIYGTDCNQVSTVLSAASAKGMKLFAGVFDITQVSSEIQTIIDAAKSNWGAIDTISIGNEGVNDGAYTVAAVTSAIGTARGMLKDAGYTGKVVTVDTFVAMIANPALCQASDYAAANCHAFFDGSVTAKEAGKFVLSQAQRISEACGGKNTVITESGWPSSGNSNGVAVPSQQDQTDAIDSLRSNFSNNLVLFSAFNDQWKKNSASTFGAEQYWGILGNSPS